jgi:hypothetical protein
MVALEAWAMGKPVLANGKCDVLRGQASRSNAGLYYENYPEFVEAVRVLESSSGVAAALGRNGSRFFRTHYAWPVIERKYLDMFERLAAEPAIERAARTMPPLPGWWARRQRALPPAVEVLAGLPAGPVRERPTARPEVRPDPRAQSRTQPRPGAGARADARGQRRPDDRRQHREPAQPSRSSGPVPASPAAAATGHGASRGRSRRGRHHGRASRKGGA